MYRWKRGGYLVVLDAIFVNVAFILAIFLRFDAVPAYYLQVCLTTFVPSTAVRILSHYFFGLYRRAWRYASVQEALAIVGAVTVGTFFNVVLTMVWLQNTLPRSIVVLDWSLCMALVGAAAFYSGWSPSGTPSPCRNHPRNL